MNGFAKTLRWYLLTNKRRFVKEFIYLCVAYFAIISTTTGFFSLYRCGVSSLEALASVYTLIMAYILASGILASNIANDLKTKQQRTLYFMVPASNSHKFWCRVMITAIMSFIVSIVAMCVADVLNILLSTIFSGTHASVSYILAANFLDIFSEGPFAHTSLAVICYIAIAAWGFTSFLLGGFLFRKMPFVMTCIAWFLFWTIVISGVFTLAVNLLDGEHYIDEGMWNANEDFLAVFTIFFSILFTVLNLWMSFRIHKRMTVIGNRMFNL